jgi:hypothetical protein
MSPEKDPRTQHLRSRSDVLQPRAGLVLLAISMAITGCSGAHPSSQPKPSRPRPVSPFLFVRAGSALLGKCRSTARAVGYPVPCLNQVPRTMNAFDRVAFIGVGQGPLWRGWVAGSTSVGTEHLVVTTSPRALRSYAKVVNGPAWYPKARVRPITRVEINGWRMRAVFVPAQTNDGSAFSDHVVLIWTVGKHTYGLGFHDLNGIRSTLLLDEALARHLTLIGP